MADPIGPGGATVATPPRPSAPTTLLGANGRSQRDTYPYNSNPIWPAGEMRVTALNGGERISIENGGAVKVYALVSDIAAFATGGAGGVAADLLIKDGRAETIGSTLDAAVLNPAMPGTLVAMTKVMLQLLTNLSGEVAQLGAVVTRVNPPVSPRALDLSVVATGGTAVTVVRGPINGGFIANPPSALGQGVDEVENLYVDMVGTPSDSDEEAVGTTVLIYPGQSFSLP